MKMMKKLIVSLVLSLLCTSVIGVSAANLVPELTVSTNKDQYTIGEDIEVNITLNNVTQKDMTDVKITSQIPEGLVLVNDESTDFTSEIIQAGESESYGYSLKSTAIITDNENPGDQQENPNQNTDKNNDIKDSADVENNVSTGDSDYHYLVVSFCICFILIFALTNKKIRNKLFVLTLIGALISTQVTNVSAVNDEATSQTLTSQQIIHVGDKDYTLVVNASYSISDNDEFVPSRDASDYFSDNLYSDRGQDKNIMYNDVTGEKYYNNELIVFFDEYIDDENIIKNIEKVISDFKVVGFNAYDKSIQIRLSDNTSYDQLNDYIAELEKTKYVKSCSLNYIFTLEECYTPNDKEWINDWDTSPKGENWWLEAINVSKIWDYKDQMTDVSIGVFDSGFDSDHEDLKNVFASIKQNKESDHGTAVSGVIGAEFDNEIGICGVFPKAKIHALSWDTINDGESILDVTLMRYKNSMTYLIAEKRCKIINCSIGYSRLEAFVAEQVYNTFEQIKQQNYMLKISTSLTESLKELLKKYNFIICQAAGNADKSYVKTDKSYLGFAEVSKDGKTYTWTNYIYNTVTHEVEEISDEETIGMFDTVYKYEMFDTQWVSPYSLITDQEVKDHIIVVGGVGPNDNGTYRIYPFSASGNRVDVLAPGEKIHSTKIDGYDNDLTGTSLSSPQVAGLAAMLYSLNSGLKGEQIKEIIVESANTEVLNAEGKKMINAWNAYDLMTQKYTGELSGKVVDEEGNPLEGANVHIQGQNRDVLTDSDGKFTIDSAVGVQEYIIQKEGYLDYTGVETVATDTKRIILKDIVLYRELSDKPVSFAGGDGTEENPYQVSTPQQLNSVRFGLDAHYIQINDIDMSAYHWKPIGYINQKNPDYTQNVFKGVYDGNNYKIDGLNLDEQTDLATIGLFGHSLGVIKNVNLENLNIDLDKSNINYPEDQKSVVYVGGICALVDSSKAEITHSTVQGSIKVTNIGDCYVGGISGAYAQIDRCKNYGNINAIAGAYMYCGGIIGEINSNMDYCINYGNISGQTTNYYTYSLYGPCNCNVGGVMGHSTKGVGNVVNYGDVFALVSTTASCSAGGIVGYNGYVAGSYLGDCYNFAKKIECIGYRYENNEMIREYRVAGRIFALSTNGDKLNLYSIDTTLVNGVLVNEGIGLEECNGLSLSEEEMNEKIQYILDEVNY